MNRSFSATDISASGLAAERLRMEVAANNIANAYATRTPEGGPYRRQRVVFASGFNDLVNSSMGENGRFGGVEVVGIESDPSAFPEVFDPGHPDANGQGMVKMPNVQLATEMVDMMTASRAYEANLQSLRSLRSMVEETLALLRSA